MPAAQRSPDPSDLVDPRALLSLARALIRIPTPNPPGDEHLAAKFLAPRLRGLGFTVRRVITPAGRWNLLAERGFEGARRAPRTPRKRAAR
ncbi:MAG: hypothetical protein ACE5FC_09110, partial [Myxococcota bacterium]